MTTFENKVIFSGRVNFEEQGEVKSYYGATDMMECLAKAVVNNLVRLFLEGN